jgi:hypothetical protein
MDDISKTDVLSILSKWERRNQPIYVLCSTPSLVLSSNTGRLAMCLDECLEFLLADGTNFRLFISEASFSRVRPDDLPAESLHFFPPFEEGVHINFPRREMRCYLFASVRPTSEVDV